MPPREITTQDAPNSDVLSRCLIVSVTLSRFGTRKKVASDQVEVDADKSLLHVAKDILDCDEIRAYGKKYGEIRQYLGNLSVPTKIFRGGFYPIPAQLITEVDEKLLADQAEIAAMSEAFLAIPEPPEGESREAFLLRRDRALAGEDAAEATREVDAAILTLTDRLDGTYEAEYERIEEEIGVLKTQRTALLQGLDRSCLSVYEQKQLESKDRLGVLWNPADYPPAAKVRQAFGMAYEYLNFSVPGRLEQISQAIYERETRKAAGKAAEAFDQIRQAMVVGAKGLVDHLKERLTPDADGKAKKFHYTAVEKLFQFIDTFGARNVTDHSELAAVVEQAKTVLQGVNPESIRKNNDLRQYVLDGMTQVSNLLEPLVTKTNGNERAFLDDEDVAA